MKKNSPETQERIRQSVLDAAEKIILDEGYQQLSSRKIAAALGCSVGSLYNAFENLNDIYLRVNQRTLKRLHEAFNVYLSNRKSDPIETLLDLSNIYMKLWEDEFPLANSLFNYSQPMTSVLPKWAQDDINAVFITILNILAPIKDKLSDSPDTVVAVLWAGLHGIATICHTGKSEMISSDTHLCLTHSFVKNYLQGLLSDKTFYSN